MDGDFCQALVLALYCFFFLFVSDLIPRFLMYVAFFAHLVQLFVFMFRTSVTVFLFQK